MVDAGVTDASSLRLKTPFPFGPFFGVIDRPRSPPPLPSTTRRQSVAKYP